MDVANRKLAIWSENQTIWIFFSWICYKVALSSSLQTGAVCSKLLASFSSYYHLTPWTHAVSCLVFLSMNRRASSWLISTKKPKPTATKILDESSLSRWQRRDSIKGQRQDSIKGQRRDVRAVWSICSDGQQRGKRCRDQSCMVLTGFVPRWIHHIITYVLLCLTCNSK